MKRLFLITMSAVIAIISSFAQEAPQGKMNVFMEYFDRSVNTPFLWVEAVRNNVMEGISNTNRVNLIDVDSRSSLAIEKERRESENIVAGDDIDRLKVMTEEGANLLVKGIVTDISTRERKDSNGKLLGYDSSITYTLKVIDPSNGTTILTKNYRLPKNDLIPDADFFLKNAATEDEAVQNRAQSAKKDMKKFVEEAFPTVGKIIELDEVKGNEAKSAYINLGSDNGMAKGAKFEVRVKRMIGGKTSLRYLGEAEVVDVESEDLAKCKIKKGGKEIYEAFKAGQDIVVKSLK